MTTPSGPLRASAEGPPALDPTQALKEKLAFYEQQFPGFFFMQRADWSFQHVDPRVESGLGLNAAQCLRHGDQFFCRIHPKDRASYWDGLLRFGETQATRTLRFRLVNEAGEITHNVLEVRHPHRLPGGLLLGYTGVWFDVSEQAELEAQVAFQAWQRSLGRVTRILLHDFRNAMTGLQTLLELYSRQAGPDHKWAEGFDLMLSTTLRTQQTVERLSQLVRDEPSEDVYLSLHDFLEKEEPFWRTLWTRPVKFAGHAEVPDSFLVELDRTTLRRFWLQLLLLYGPMEEDTSQITFTWRPLPDGHWVVGDAFPFGFRAADDGWHLALSPCPSPFAEAGSQGPTSREWPSADWRQLQEFADALKVQMAFCPGERWNQPGVLHLFWAGAQGRQADPFAASTVAPTAAPRSTPEVLLIGEWERDTVEAALRKAGLQSSTPRFPPKQPVHGIIFLGVEIPPAWDAYLRGAEAPSRAIYLHSAEAQPPEDLPERLFTLPTKLPENHLLLELQLHELLR